tara:strand:+ start:2961 stop:4589 length:1629 start_codon:yes stop_codon:yes gene_type:complete
VGKWFTEADLREADLIWLLNLKLGGVEYLFANETISISSNSGDRFHEGTLTGVDLSSTIEFATPDFEMPSASMEVTFRIDLALLIAQGLDLGSGTGELSLYRKDSGDDYDDRVVVLEGVVDAASYGAVGEPIGIVLEADFLRSSNKFPPPAAVIDKAVNWPNSEDNVQGAVYPIIIGSPGREGFAGSPVYIVEDTGGSSDRKGLIAAHPCTASTITVTGIQADGSTFTVSPDPAVVSDVDTNGQVFSYVLIPNAHFAADNSFFARFNEGGGGLINPYRPDALETGSNSPGTLSGAGDVIRYLLHQSGVRVDDGRTATAAQALNVYSLDGYVAEIVDTMDFLKDEILPLLPCSLRTSSEGIYPVVWRYDAREEDVKISLTADVDIFRDSMVEYISSEIFNEITINYRHNCRFNKLMKKLTITGDPFKQLSGFVWSNDYTLSSANRYGTRSMEVETELVSSRATAGRIINWMSRAYSQRHRQISYKAPTKLSFLEIGDIISVSDDELSWDEQILMVQSVEWGETELTFTFLLIPDIPRDMIPLG